MITPSISLASMAMNPFTPSKIALEDYLNVLIKTLAIVNQVYTPCTVDNMGPIGLFLIENGFKIETDQYGITISK